MKKKVMIVMDIDTDREGSSGAAPMFDQPGPEGIEVYKVRLNSDSSLDVAAHEMGHVLSSVFELPGGMLNDPRPNGEFETFDQRMSLSMDQADRMWSNERLAWQIAEKIHPNLSQEQKKKALDSYLDNFKLPKAA